MKHLLSTVLESSSERGKIGSIRLDFNSNYIELEESRTYLIIDENQDRFYRVASSISQAGKKVLLISRLHPDVLRQKIGREIDDTIWLSERPGSKSIAPYQLGRIVNRADLFTKTNRSPAVLFDGLEYLSLFNQFMQLQIFIEHLNDVVMESHAILVIAVDPRLFDQCSLAKIRRFAEVLF